MFSTTVSNKTIFAIFSPPLPFNQTLPISAPDVLITFYKDTTIQLATWSFQHCSAD